MSTITRAQSEALAKRLAQLPAQKRTLFRATLEKEGIDPWQLPIVANPERAQQNVLSYAQQRMWFFDQVESGTALYNISFALQIDGDLDYDCLEQSINDIINRHEILRTNIVNVDGEGRQTIGEFSALSIPIQDLFESQDQDDEGLQDLIAQEMMLPFDLVNDPHMMRVKLVRRTNFSCVEASKNKHMMILSFQHVSFDAFSINLFVDELQQAYSHYRKNSINDRILAEQLDAKIALQYVDYAHWQRQWLESQGAQKQIEYWKKTLSDIPTEPMLPTCYPRPSVMRYEGTMQSLRLSPELSTNIEQLVQSQGVTFYMFMLAAFNVLLSLQSSQDDVVVGTSIANRSRAETANMLGVFINSLVMRNQLDNTQSFNDFLKQVRDNSIQAYDHQELPFDQVVDALGLERQNNISPLFQILFVVNNALDGVSLSLDGVDVSLYPIDIKLARLDLTIRITQDAILSDEKGILCEIEYNTELYSEQRIQILLEQYQTVLSQIVSNPNQALSNLSLYGVSDKQELMLVGAPLITPDDIQSVSQQFEYWVEQCPDKVALISGDVELSYEQLNNQANRLAAKLQELGLKSQQHVGILLERSANTVVSLLAVLKAGGAYVPLDEKWPLPRIQQIVDDAELRFLISEKASSEKVGREKLAACGVELVFVDEDLSSCSNENLSSDISSNRISPNNSAYLIYTSGSTGTPKGVVVEHQQVLAYALGVTQKFDLAGLQFASVSSVATDLGNTAVFGALCTGGTLNLVTQETLEDADVLSQYLANYKVDVLKITPSFLQGLLNAASKPIDLIPNTALMVGGEACDVSLIEQVNELAPTCRLINHYGPTETTIGALAYEYQAEQFDSKLVFNNALPIGQPLPGYSASIRNSSGQLCDQNVPGELVIGGAGVSRGYYRQTEMTEEKYVINELGQRCYRTGDRARLLASGVIEFLGRFDEQIKIRGYRVELNDIKACLMAHDNVQSAVVRYASEPNQIISAFVVANENIDEVALSIFVSSALPDYMVPKRIYCLDTLPLTINGKVDVKALDELLQSDESGERRTELRQPTNDAEQALMNIWQQVLNRDGFGIDDDFFALGGDSILSLQIIAQAKRAGYALLPKQLFEHQTIAELAGVAKVLESNDKKHDELVTGDVAITPIQRWFLQTEHPQAEHWNQSLVLESKQALDSTALQNAVAYLVGHHDQLRTEFLLNDFIPRQKIVSWELELGEQYYHRVDGFTESDFVNQVNEWQASLSFEAENKVAQMFKVVHFVSNSDNKERQGSDRLVLIAHHLLVDGVSWRVLMDDLLLAYQHALSEQVSPSFPPAKPDFASKTASFQAWSKALQKASEDRDGDWKQQAKNYWSEMSSKLSSESLVEPLVGHSLIMPRQHKARLGDVQNRTTRLDQAQTQALLQSAPKAYKTGINDLLLSALSMAVAKQCPDQDIYLELEGHGREALDNSLEELDVSRTVGWFTSRFPVLLKNSSNKYSDKDFNKKLGNLICSVKEQLRAIPSNGLAYGVLTQLGDMAPLPNPMLSFNYLGQTDNTQQAAADAFTAMNDIEGVIERHNDNKVTHGLSVNAIVRNGEFEFSLHWEDSVCNLDIEQLSQDYLSALRQVIEHCGDELQSLTPSDFPLLELEQNQLDGLVDKIGITELENAYSLTSLQEGMLFHAMLAESNSQNSKEHDSAYFNQLVVDVNGDFDAQLFKQAWQLNVARHTILRSSFWATEVSTPIQVVHKNAQLPVLVQDWRGEGETQQSDKLASFMQSDRAQGFDLQQAPLMRVALLQLNDEHWKLVWSRHHLLLDGWSSTRLIQEVMITYFALRKGAQPEQHPLLANSPKPFSDYIAWLQNQDNAKAENFWRNYLQGFDEAKPILLTTDDRGHQYHSLVLTSELSQQLDSLAKQSKVTLNTVMQGAWSLLLSRYIGNDVIFGMTTAGRPSDLSGVDSMLGLFINTLPVRLQIDLTQTLPAFLSSVQQNQIEVRDFEHMSLPQIQTWSEVDNGQALFESLLVFENYLIDEDAMQQLEMGEQGLSLQTETSHEPTNYPITLTIVPDVDKGIELRFATNNINRAEFSNVIDYLQTVLSAFASTNTISKADTQICKLCPLPQTQKESLEQWNETHVEMPSLGVEQLFANQASANAKNTAAQFAEQKWTYQELNERANQLARALQEQGVKPNQLVGVYQKRSLNLLVSVLAVMKAGAAYVPLDPNYPQERIDYMMQHSGLELLIVDQSVFDDGLLTLEQKNKFSVINVSDAELVSSYSTDELELTALPSDLAYVIYTSGSTGLPKGVQITRANLTNFIKGMQQLLPLSSEDRLLAVTSLSFDIATLELYLPLICGAQVVIGDEQLSMDGQRLKCLIADHDISVMQATPVSWKVLLAADWKPQKTDSFTALCGGEAFPIELARSLTAQPIDVWNMYGPTETSVWSCAYKVSADVKSITNTVPIGKPIANTQCYILDDQLNVLPQGVAGQLYIAGDGVALGYLAEAEMTSERFIDSVFGRVYQTGDLARYRHDGVMECLGRIDNQVKIRGFRIELGEIEQCLLKHAVINDVVVNPYHFQDEPVLAAYAVCEDGTSQLDSTLISDLKAHVAQQLPNYMVPTFFVALEDLPLTPNGKVDRKALPEPLASDNQTQYQAPNTQTEQILCAIWQDVLGIAQVGVNDNFFELGGHSLLVIRVITRLQEHGVNANVQDLFTSPCLKDLAAAIDQNSTSVIFKAPERLIPLGCQEVTPQMLPLIELSQTDIDLISESVPGGMSNIADIYPLGPLQEGIYFHHLMSQGNDPYVFPNLLRVSSREQLDTLLDALNFIVNRHEVLRTLVVSDGLSQAVQVVCHEVELPVVWHQFDVDVEAHMQAMCDGDQWLDVDKAPLLRLNIAQDGEHYHVLLQYHHLISDHEGLAIIQRELMAFFSGLSDALPTAIPYREFVAHAQHQLENGHAKEFFEEMLSDIDEPTLPFGLTNTQSDGRQIIDRREPVSQEVAQRIRALSKSMQINPASLFHAAWAMVISACSGREEVVFGSVLSGRLQGTLGAEHMMGVFINTLPIRVDVDSSSVKTYVESVHQSLTSLLSYEQTPLVTAQGCSAMSADQPLFSALMNYRHSGPQDDQTQSIDGIEFVTGSVRNNYPLTLSIDDFGDQGFGLAGLFDESVDADRLLAYVQRALVLMTEALVDNKDVSINQLSVLSQEEQQALLTDSVDECQNKVDSQFSSQAVSIQTLFEAQAKTNPNNDAVVYQGDRLSYQSLNEQANRLAHYLRTQGVQADVPVAIYMDRSPSLIVSILAVLKSDACYLPLDTQWPSSRIQGIVNDAGVSILLSEAKWQASLTELNAVDVCMVDQNEDLAKYSDADLESQTSIKDAAYVIYTSGSTGTPKGVVIEHRQLFNYVQGIEQRLGLNGMSFAHISTIAADLGNTSLFGALCYGGALHLIDADVAFDPDQTANVLQDYPVDALKIVPGHLQGLLAAENAQAILPKKLLILGGEACPISLLQTIKKINPNLKIVNHYGPSETTVGVLTHEIIDEDIQAQKIPVGKALPKTHAYVLDSAGKLAPQGVTGELYIGGASVARGYLNRDDLTEERFIENAHTQSRVYRTGDRVRRREDGDLEFLGRVDNQVKVRGYRVELGDIETCLYQHSQVSEVSVKLEKGDVSDVLTAYIASSESLSKDELAQYCTKLLPEYMVPQSFIIVEALPRTANGKVDFRQLSSMAIANDSEVTRTIRGATNDAERALVEIWQNVLRRDDFGVDDDFFELGGDSILSLQIIAQAKRAGYALLPKQLFEYQTIAELAGVAKVLESNDKKHDELVTGDVAITPIQRWFLQTEHPQAEHWNQSLVLESKQALDSTALQNAVAYLVGHHDQLRTEFLLNDFIPRQQVVSWELELGEQYYHRVDGFTDSDFANQENEWQANLSFEAENKVAKMFKVVHFVAGKDSGSLEGQSSDRLVLIAHHLLVDGVSWRVLMDDLLLAYQHALSEKVSPSFPSAKPDFASKTASFQTWSKALQKASEERDGNWQQQAKNYWAEMSSNLESNSSSESLVEPLVGHNLIMPRQHKARLGDVQNLTARLDQAQTQALLQSAPKAYKTGINDLLLSAFSMAVTKQCPNQDVYLELEGHGREALDSSFEELDVSRTVGWFTSRFPVLLKNSVENDSEESDNLDNNLGNLICSVKEQLKAIPSNGLAYGVLTQMGDMAPLPNPLLSFNYLGQTDSAQDNEHSFSVLDQTSDIVERSHENKVTHGISINAIVIDGELQINMQSVPSLLILNDKQSLNDEQLLNDFAACLTQVVQFCGDEFRAFTPSDFPSANIDQHQLQGLVEQVGADKLQDIYGMTSLQEGMLFHTLMSDGSDGSSEGNSKIGSAYFNQLRINFEGTFNSQAFEKAWQLMFERHSILRTSFWSSGANEPVQVVNKECSMPITYVDLSIKHTSEHDAEIEQFMLQDRQSGFDLQQPPLMRTAIFKLSDQHFQMLWSRHHILLDGWSSTRLIQEVMSAYHAFNADVDPSLAPLLSQKPIPYRRYIDWLQKENGDNGTEFWKTYLAGIEDPSYVSISRDSSGYEYATHQLTASLSQQLSSTAKQHQVTLNSLLQAAWGLLLTRYKSDHQSPDIMFGMTSAGRSTDLSGAQEMLGLFINTLPVRLEPEFDSSVQHYLQAVQANQVEVRDYEHVSLAEIQSISGIDNGQALFDSLLVFENYYVDQDAKQQLQDDSCDLQVEFVSRQEPTNYPITLSIVPNIDSGIELRFTTHNIDTAEFDEFVAYFKAILERIAVSDQQTTLINLIELPETQSQLLMQDWNATEQAYPKLGVESLFSQQAQQTPEKTAVGFADQSLSYQKLDQQSNQLANLLVDSGVKPGDLIGVSQQRSLSLLVSVLAVMKAGAAYVPLDPNYPLDRLEYMVKDSGLNLLLCDQSVLDRQLFDSAGFNLQTVKQGSTLINVDHDGLLNGHSIEPITQLAKPSDLAYVIYTSGSTGLPKGVKITRDNLTNFICSMQHEFKLGVQDRLLAVTSLSFDIATLELYLPLVAGAEVLIGDEFLSMDGHRLQKVIESGVSIMQATPVTWKLLLSAGWPKLASNLNSKSASSFRALCGGEAFPVELANDLLAQNDQQPVRVFNMYGPTETTVWSSVCELHPKLITNTVPVGRPIDNTQTYVLDEKLRPMPIGVAGELYIGGAGVAEGYLGQPDLTEQRFVEFNGERIYQTGDLARFRYDGVLECLGRLDNQVKIRGYRIELGEIEHCLLQHDAIEDAVVNPFINNDEAVLVAYVIVKATDNDEQQGVSHLLKQHVSQRLPAYMVPTFVVQLEELPLTPNGKVDRKALPAPTGASLHKEYRAPNNQTETQLCGIWQEVLGVDQVGIDDDFFELGGHSLTAIRLQAKINQELTVQLALRDLFEHNSIAEVAQQIELQLAANLMINTNNLDKELNQETSNNDDDIEEFEL